jgi:hypothetical protein
LGIFTGYFRASLTDRVVKRIALAPGAQNRAAAGKNSRDRFDRQGNSLVRPDQPIEAILDAHNAPTVFNDG